MLIISQFVLQRKTFKSQLFVRLKINCLLVEIFQKKNVSDSLEVG